MNQSADSGEVRGKQEIFAAERAVREHPADETAYGTLIHAYSQAGRRADALRVCLELNEMLEASGRTPRPETRLLMESLSQSPLPEAARPVARRGLLKTAAFGLIVIGTLLPLIVWRNTVSAPPSRTDLDRLLIQASQTYQSGQYDQAEALVQEAAAGSRRIRSYEQEGQALLIWSEIKQARGDLNEARELVYRGFVLHLKSGNAAATAHALDLSANVAAAQGDFAEARRTSEESLSLWEKSGDTGGVIQCLREQGSIAAETGQIAQARRDYTKVLALAQPRNMPDMVTNIQMLQGTLEGLQGDFNRAESLLQKSLKYWQSKPEASPRWIAATCNRLAQVALLRGQPARAQKWLAQSLPVYMRVRDKRGEADTHALLGRALLQQGDLRAAEREMRAALTFYDAAGMRPRAARVRLALASLYRADNRQPEAQSEQILAERLLQQTGSVLSSVERASLAR